jgi:pimeloyl-ACP methyl ester carboxylesterase
MILVGANLSPDGLTTVTRKALQLLAAGKGIKGVFSKKRNNDRELVRLMLDHPHSDPRRLEKITVPTLIINGEKDIIRDEHSKLIAASLPNARRAIIPGVGHFVMKDAPAEFDHLIFEFLMEED